jgi:hypothetical protein
MEGPVQRIEESVRDTIAILGQDGGYFCGPDQHLPFPPEHRDALEKAVEDHGRYPLKSA